MMKLPEHLQLASCITGVLHAPHCCQEFKTNTLFAQCNFESSLYSYYKYSGVTPLLQSQPTGTINSAE